MYIKYTPASSIRSNGVVRDITRAITSGSISSHEFSDGISNNNTIEGNTSTGWTLDSRDTISSDATPGQNDQKYRIYNTTAVSGVKKAVSLKQNGNHTNSGIYNSDLRTNASGGLGIFPLMAYESTEELECHGYNGTSSSYKPYNTYNPGTSGSDTTLHVFASQKYIVQAGYSYENTPTIQGYIEVDKTGMHHKWEAITGRTSPSAIYFRIAAGHTTPQADPYYGYSSGQSNSDFSITTMPEMMYNGMYNKAYKSVSWSYENNEFNGKAMADDGTSTGTTTGSSANYDWPGSHFATNYRGFYNHTAWMDVRTFHDWGTDISGNPYMASSNYYLDAAGTKHIPLFPLLLDASFYVPGTLYNLSKYCPIYYTLPMQGNFGDTMTIGSDKYIYLGWSTSTSTKAPISFFMKVE